MSDERDETNAQPNTAAAGATRPGLLSVAVATALTATGCSGAPKQAEQPITDEKASTVESTETDAAKATDEAKTAETEASKTETKEGDDGVEPDEKDNKGWNAGGARG